MKPEPLYMRIYKRNEELNNHAENLVMLSSIFGDKLERRLASMNLQRRDRLGHVDSRMNALAQTMIGPYAYELFKLAEAANA